MLGRNARILPGAPEAFEQGCRDVLKESWWSLVDSPASLTLAPLLTRRVRLSDFPGGLLIFHPSALPYRRGPDAIRHTVTAGERVSAATWFLADEGLDTGPIVAQEVVVLKPGESAGRAYHTRFIPAAVEALRTALWRLSINRRPKVQDEALATYDGRFRAEKNVV
ncbi:MAG: hypothetical protein KDA81_18645 [Planctomycetaceae bacterium]|nr:hypothetical protein [Planctomycetaceae bacterium]